VSGARARQPEDAEWRPRANPWIIAIVVTLAAFMEVLDTTIVNVSLPHIAGTMSVSYDDATWTLTSYLVANGIVLPVSGWIGRVIGRKRYFLICIGAFTLCSFLCGIANSLGELILFRLAQGFFGGGLQPNQQSIILDTFEPAQRGRAFAVVAIAVIMAPIIGPTLGGWITDHYNWRWIFLINVPVGIGTLFAVTSLVEDPPWVQRDRSSVWDADFVGLSLIALGFGCLEIMLDRGEENDWFGSSYILTFGILAALGIFGAIAWLLYTEKPVVDIRVFKDRNFAVGCVVIFSIGAILYSSAVLIPQLAQQVLGYTATLAGLLLSPGAVVTIVLIPVVTRLLLPNVQTRFIIAFGFFSMGCALAYAHNLVPDVDFRTLAFMRAGQTFALAFLFVPNTTITYSTLPRELNSDASSLYVMLRNVAGSIGISLATSMLTERTQVRHNYLTDNLGPLDPGYTQTLARIEQSLRAQNWDPATIASTARGIMNQTLNTQASVLAYTDVFAICAILAFCVVPICLLFRGSKAGGGGAPAH
jgi:MFS transporter, DHA2 family, multidrug resistance protein